MNRDFRKTLHTTTLCTDISGFPQTEASCHRETNSVSVAAVAVRANAVIQAGRVVNECTCRLQKSAIWISMMRSLHLPLTGSPALWRKDRPDSCVHCNGARYRESGIPFVWSRKRAATPVPTYPITIVSRLFITVKLNRSLRPMSREGLSPRPSSRV